MLGERTVRVVVALCTVTVLLLLIACSGNSGQVTLMRPTSEQPSRALPTGVSLDEAISGLEGLVAPEFVDGELFQQLKDEFARRLRDRGISKIISVPPVGVANQVGDLAIIDDGEGNYSLTWGYVNLGDYDQNGTVGISDITPMAVHYGKTVDEQDSLEDVTDGSRDGSITIADITPIAVNYSATCEGYSIEGLSSPGSWTAIDTVSLSSASGDVGRLQFSHSLASLAHDFYRVIPYDDAGAEGARSSVFPSTAPQPPNIVEVEPLEGAAGEAVSFSVVAEGAATLVYSWNFGGGSSPNTASVSSPLVTLGAEGAYSASLSVSNDQGSDSFPFTLTVNPAGEPPTVNSVTPLDGYTGDVLTFFADVSGDEPLSYEWNFGGGGTPNESSQASPIIALGEPGKYFCGLQVSNQWGYAPFYQFEMWVYSTGGTPITITGVQPLEARSGRETIFGVTTTGDEPDYFLWDFGGGADPNTAYWATPSVVPGVVGTYDACVTVGNIYGPADTYEFTLTVIEDTGWPINPVQLDWLQNRYLPLPPLTSSNRVFQTAEYRQWADQMLTLINAERSAAGVGAVAFEPHLEALGTAHCKHMATVGFFGHTNPQGMTPVDRLECINPPLYDFPGLTHGENIAAGQTSPEQVMSEWMDSTMHRYNLLHAPWTHVGIGIYHNPDDSQGYKTYWATEFVQFIGDPDSHNWIDPGDTPP